METMPIERKPEYFKGAQLKVGIIGCGYVGLPLGLRFAEAGHRVTGFDVDTTKVEKLNRGETLHPAHSCEQDQAARRVKTFRRRPRIFRKLADMDAIIICVPTPLDERREPDLSYVGRPRLSPFAPHLADGPAGRAGIHHVSGHDRRTGAADSGKEGLSARSRTGRMQKISRRISFWRFRPSAKIPATNNMAWRKFQK